ncbi:hypothetical protein GJAV_G00027130 [Gymnothorax javanicus]|nr:hypothetical protein GJAV_G00027130 [Gymnothorax javanicus]
MPIHPDTLYAKASNGSPVASRALTWQRKITVLTARKFRKEKTLGLVTFSRIMARKMFPVLKYRAINYICEASTRQKLKMNWLVLPVPYHLECSDLADLYPHTGALPEVSYRTPWTRGMVISTCKLVVAGSILEDLMSTGEQVDFNEKFGFAPVSHGGGSVLVVTSSNPDSQCDLDADETLWLLDGLEKDTAVCRETFSKVTEELLCQKQPDILSLYLKEETLFTDHLLRFRGQLPQLRTMLGRLKTLSVLDPLLCPARDGLSEDLLFSRHCLPFEETQEAGAELSGPGLAEDIWHVPRYVLQEESLALPMVLEPRKLGEQCRPSSTRELQELFQLIPEEMDNDISCQEILRKDEPARLWVSKEISDFQMADCPQGNLLLKSPGFYMDITHPAHHRLYSQLETDVTLTPPRVHRTPSDRLSCVSALPVEHMSPVYRHCLMSNSAREALEEALWKAEKHLPAVLSLRLAEPQVPDSILLSRSALDTLKLMSSAADHNDLISREPEDFPLSEAGPVHSCSLVLEMRLGAHSEFVERMDYDDIESVPAFTENFLPLSFSQLDDILGECGDDPGCPRHPITPAPIKANPTTSSVTDALGSSCQEIEKPNEQIVIEQTATNQCRDPEPVGRAGKSGTISSAQVKRDVCWSFTLKPDAQGVQSCCPVSDLEEALDPLSSFMMLRSQPKPKVTSSPQNYSCRGQSKPEPNVAIEPKEAVKPRSDQRTSKVISAARGNLVGVQEASSTARAETRVDSQVICVQASESQRRAYRVLHAKAASVLPIALEQGLIAGAAVDFGTLPLDHARFLLKQQERQRSIGGKAHEKDVLLYQQVALIHLLVTARDLLLNCDLSTALDYLAGTKLTNMNAGTGELWGELRILEYLSQRNMEPNPKLQELQEQMKAWMQKNSLLRLCSKALVIITFDCDSLKEMLVNTLSDCTGAPATTVCPEENCGKLDSCRVKESLQQCWCAVVCGQHIGPDFPWQCFSLAVEFDPLTPSSWAAVCRERGISHMSMQTMVPSCEEDPTDAQNQLIPFSLLITESVLNSHMLLQTLESTYNMTVLERDYPHSLKMLGGTSRYFVITVDESTAVLIQELEELSTKRSSENFILRMTALSLQYSCCWVIFYCPDGQGLGYRFGSEVFNNLVLIYSSFVLFGLKSENLDIKVLIVAEASCLAECIQRICHQALMSSGRDPVSWLDRDWLSVMPSEEEECLTMFPSISPLVAQLMLKRAPSLQWLLGATLPQLMELLPEVPHKVMKLFSDTTALYKLNVSHSPLDSPAKATEGGANGPDSPWGFDTHDPCDDPESFGADHVSPFDESSAYEVRSSAHVAHIADNNILDRTDEVVDFMHYLGTAVSGNSFLRNSVGSQRGAYESREMGTGRLSLSNGPIWSVRETQISSIGTSLPQCRPPFRNGSASCPSGSSNCQPVPFGEGPAGQQPCYTPTTCRALPTSAGSQWKTSPFGHATRPIVNPCDYRLEALTHPDAESHRWNRPGQKRSAYAAELGEWRADVPRQKKGKLTYEKVSGRTDGQTRLIFF